MEDKRLKPLEELPILPVKGTVVFPYLIVPLVVSNEKLIKLVDETLADNKILGLFTQRDSEIDEPKPEDLYRVGTAANIVKMLRFPDGTLRILVQGLARAMLEEVIAREPYYRARVKVIKEDYETTLELEAMMRNVVGLFRKLVELAPYLPEEVEAVVINIEDASKLADFIASNINFEVSEKQRVLETFDPRERLELLTPLLSKELSVLELGAQIRSQVKTEMDKDQREYYLREQLKAIQKELGERDERTIEIEEFKEKIVVAKMPREVEETANREVERLAKMPVAAAEYTVSRTYLEWLVNLPWVKETQDNLDIEGAEKILDEDHYDLEDVKERIVEYLAIRKLRAETKGPILCFVGPPGVGKTSLGMSIARALGRKFIRFSLGGIRDEAEIRGHRRTYVGALPGRVIQGIRRAGSKNPVFMLDEVDKIGVDFRGDPASALLEVLDPEQNHSFSDHYLDVAYDLSRVMFITTANIVDPIPPALKDRMEVLKLPGYTLQEKAHIARKFLIPRQVKENGLSGRTISFSKESISTIIGDYTREAGVRNLEREIASICRKIAKGVARGKTRAVKITPRKVRQLLGPAKHVSEVRERRGEVGVATGVAWTSSGGEILFVEATKMRGNRNLTLTGQLGEIMKESAEAALSYVRSKAKQLRIEEDFFDKYDIHIHVPAGAIPKDGPSAGVTMAVALASLLSERPVHPDIALTGEITLRGKVLPVGGVKEKVLAAKRAGIKEIVLPDRNKKDLEEVPERAKRGLEFKFIHRIDQAVEHALVDRKKRVRLKSKAKRKPGTRQGSRRATSRRTAAS